MANGKEYNKPINPELNFETYYYYIIYLTMRNTIKPNLAGIGIQDPMIQFPNPNDPRPRWDSGTVPGPGHKCKILIC